MNVEFHDVRGSKWTFEDFPVRKWVLERTHGRVLNACAGETPIGFGGGVVRNDIDEDSPADTHLDVRNLADEFGPESFDSIVFDPPWSGFQSNKHYDGGDVNWTREIKKGFDTMIRPRGTVIQLGYSASCMPGDLGYSRESAAIFAPYGRRKAFIGVECQKVPQLHEYGEGCHV